MRATKVGRPPCEAPTEEHRCFEAKCRLREGLALVASPVGKKVSAGVSGGLG